MTKPWSTMPVTGAQHDAWLAEEEAPWEMMYFYPEFWGNAEQAAAADPDCPMVVEHLA